MKYLWSRVRAKRRLSLAFLFAVVAVLSVWAQPAAAATTCTGATNTGYIKLVEGPPASCVNDSISANYPIFTMQNSGVTKVGVFLFDYIHSEYANASIVSGSGCTPQPTLIDVAAGGSCQVQFTFVSADNSSAVTLTATVSKTLEGDYSSSGITISGGGFDIPPLLTTLAVPLTTLVANSANGLPFTPVTASGGFGTITYALSGGTLPTGLSFDTSNGQITGTPTALLAATTFTVTASDSYATPQTSTKTFSFAVNLPSQSITFDAPPTQYYKPGGTVTLTAAGGASGLPVTFASNSTDICTTGGTNGAVVSFVSAGTCSITASQAGNANYAAATPVTRSFLIQDTIKPATQAIGGFISDRANLLVSNLFDMNRGMDRLNRAQGQGGSSTNNFANDDGKTDLLATGFGLSGRPLAAGGSVNPTARLASSDASGMQDLYGLQAMLYQSMQHASQTGTMDSFSYSGPFNATLNAQGGFTCSFQTSLSQIAAFNERVQSQEAESMGFSGAVHAAKASRLDIWAEGTYVGYGGERTGNFGLLSLGSDYVLNPSLLLGVFTQIDTTHQTSGTTLSGTGWMAGPYVTARLTDRLFWNGRAAFGRSGNTLTGSGDFTSTRWLVSSSLAGQWEIAPHLAFNPDLGFTYFADVTDGYVDSYGAPIPGVRTELGQVKLSPKLTYGFATDSGLWIEPSIAPELIWNFASTNVDGLGPLADTATGPTGLRGRMKAGLTFRTERGVSISATGFYDGIGAVGYSSISGQATVSVPLN